MIASAYIGAFHGPRLIAGTAYGKTKKGDSQHRRNDCIPATSQLGGMEEKVYVYFPSHEGNRVMAFFDAVK